MMKLYYCNEKSFFFFAIFCRFSLIVCFHCHHVVK
jgi:hypothetical protein